MKQEPEPGALEGGRGKVAPLAYSLRPATPGDLEGLRAVHESAFRGLVETRYDWDPDQQRQIVLESIPHAQIVEVAGALAGQLIVEEREDEVFLSRVMLGAAYRGRGLGAQIVGDVIARARASGRAVTLSVWENNRARGLYERLGFRVTHQEGFRVKMRLAPAAEG